VVAKVWSIASLHFGPVIWSTGWRQDCNRHCWCGVHSRLSCKASGEQQQNKKRRAAIGFTVMACAYAFGPISGEAFNPAVGMLPALHHSLDTIWIYWVGPVVGAVAIVFWLTNPLETVDKTFDTGSLMSGLHDNEHDLLMGTAAQESHQDVVHRSRPKAMRGK